VAARTQLGIVQGASKDFLEMFVEVLDSREAQLVEDPPHRDAVVGIRIAAPPGGDQDRVSLVVVGAYVRCTVLMVAEHEAHLGG